MIAFSSLQISPEQAQTSEQALDLSAMLECISPRNELAATSQKNEIYFTRQDTGIFPNPWCG